ncbi:hypothetical protein AA0119_g3004 [Alternaria tenuissima]|uniref:Uncharacterized protein n=2 Tax=Alternaria alternata complex TaxID=187734 RepID=A0A4Q4NMT8_ALTAL|nr:hypothetical protein AA0115_g3735 [Alternaria tenuissima]RYN78505.1 hypothetical protein AA0117_g4261 [Alternaria alternata]RYO06122.1 hypothetical protein AA0119_g3004 [Alternaria tenuissima]RYO17877.1 hypothetical protein AA0121_g5546 [Alternaria tenuissima]
MSDINITNERPSYQAVFSLDVITAAGALILLGLASRPTFKRIKQRRFTAPGKENSARDGPLKTTLGTYLFLWPALLCLFVAYVCRFVSDLLKTSGTIDYTSDLGWNGRRAYTLIGSEYSSSISALTFTTTLATIFFTVLLNGGVWIHSSHVQENGTGISTPKTMSRIWNTFIMFAMLGTGVAAWGLGMEARDISTGSSGPDALLSWSNVMSHDRATRITYIVHEAIVVAASLSVSAEVLREYGTTNKNAHGSPERHDLARFAFVVVPLIWLRDIFIIYDIILLYVDTSGWSNNAVLATTFLLVICRQFATLAILGMVLWGAWRMGRSVSLFGGSYA